MKLKIVYGFVRFLSKFLGFLLNLSKKLSNLISRIRNYLSNTIYGGDI